MKKVFLLSILLLFASLGFGLAQMPLANDSPEMVAASVPDVVPQVEQAFSLPVVPASSVAQAVSTEARAELPQNPAFLDTQTPATQATQQYLMGNPKTAPPKLDMIWLLPLALITVLVYGFKTLYSLKSTRNRFLLN